MPNVSREHVPELDGIRAIACLLVLWVHLGPASFQPPTILAAGSTGVDLFFVLSGFLITRILLYNRHHGIPLGTFMIKRAARIFPVAYLGLALCLAIRPSWEMIYSAVYLQNLAAIFDLSRGVMCTHYWTLAIEEQFYLVVPFIVLFWPPKSLRLFLITICLGCIASIYAIAYQSPSMDRLTLDLAITCGTTTRGWLLLAGSLIACFESHVRFRMYTPLVVSTCLVAMSAALVSPSFSALGLQEPVTWFGGPSGFGDGMLRRQLILLALFIFALSPIGRSTLTLLRDPLLSYIGARSYGLYVYHMAVFEVLGVRKGLTTTESAWLACLALALTWLVAELSYRYVELPVSSKAARLIKSTGVAEKLPSLSVRISGEQSPNTASQEASTNRAA